MRRLAAALVIALGVLVQTAETASGQAVQCGQVITEDTTLDSDLSCPLGSNGLVVGADGVTIDLNGHEVAGAVFPGGAGGVGIDNSAGYDGVTVRDGSVRGFGRGVVLTDASDNRVAGLRVDGVGTTALTIEGGAANTVVASDLTGRFSALVATGSDGMRIAGNTANGFFASDAMSIQSSLSVIAHNTTGTTGTGSVSIRGSSNRIVDNQLFGQLFASLALLSGSGNLAARNTASLAVDGIFVSAETTGTVLRRNVASRNGDDGIDVESPDTRLIANEANENGDLGIEAVAGVFGAANHASGNLNPLQCLNVVCR